MTLLELLEREYAIVRVPLETSLKLRNFSFSQLIKDDDECLSIIKSIMEFKDNVSLRYKERASHIIVTWLLGVALEKVLGVETPPFFMTTYFEQLWMYTAAIHDYGYFCDEIMKRDLPIYELTRNYDLLVNEYKHPHLQCLNGIEESTETSSCFSYSYELIRNYFEYSKFYHRDDPSEFCDHGIVGGCKAFRRYCETITSSKHIYPSDPLTRIHKIACYIAASHNIYKSTSEQKDADYHSYGLYEIDSKAKPKVTKTNKLLYLMSLVDTIECTKRFSKKSDAKEYLIQSTTLQYVDIYLEQGTVTVDFLRLYEYLVKTKRSPEMLQKVKDHIKGIRGLSQWTEFKVENKSDEWRVIIHTK